MLTMMMSIVHRITGAAPLRRNIAPGVVLLAAASGPNAYAKVQWFMGTFVGRLILFGYTWALIHHMFAACATSSGTPDMAKRVEREWLVRIGLAGSILTAVVLWIVVMPSWEARNEHPEHSDPARPRPQVGSAKSGHRALLAQRLTALAMCRSPSASSNPDVVLGRGHRAVVQILARDRRDRPAAVHRLGDLSHEARHAGHHRGLRPRRGLEARGDRRQHFLCHRVSAACVYALLKLSFGV